MTLVRRLGGLLAAGILLTPVLPQSAARADDGPAFRVLHAAPVQLRLGPARAPSERTFQQHLVADPAPGPVRSTWQVSYTGFTDPARAAFQAAVDIWSRLVASPVPIRVDASFQDLGSGVLGSAGAANYYSQVGLGDGVSAYPSALADDLHGSDIGGTDIDAQFSSTYGFYFGTDGATPAGQVDFESVVLHELAHGLGFAGFMDYSGGQGFFGGQPGRFDTFAYDAASGGSRLTSYADPSVALGAALTGGSVYWGGPAGVASNGGARPKLYAPSTWQEGSSYAHLDESTYPTGSANSLMTYAIGPGEAVHSPGPVVVGMLNDLGYQAYVAGAVTTPDPPTGVTATPGDAQATVSWAAGGANGATVTGSTVTASPGGRTAVVTGSGRSGTVTGLSNGTAYTFRVTQTTALGTSAPSASSAPVTPAAGSTPAPSGPPGAPGQVTGVTAVAGRTSATVTWSAAAGNGSAVTGYVVTPSSGAPVTVGPVTSAVVDGLADATPYTFTVHAVNALGAGPESVASAPVTPDAVAPTLTVRTPATFSLGTTASVSFSATDGGSGVAGYLVRVRRAAYNRPFGSYGASRAVTAHSYTTSAPRGWTTCTSVAARDRVGNTTRWSLDRCTTVPLDDRSLAATSAFRRLTSSAAYAGTYSRADRAGHYVRLSSAVGRRVVLVATTCSTCGSVRVTFGSVVKTVSLASSTSHWRWMIVVDFGAVRSGALTVTTTSGKPVYVDGLGIARA